MMAAISDVYRGDDEAAERNLREALALDRHNSEIWIALATFLSARGRAGEAADVLRGAIGELEETGLLRLLLASTLLRSGSVAEAEIVLLRAQPLLPDRQNEIHQMLAEVSARKSYSRRS
jgi:predicted Zn-dependent protease